MAPVAGNATVTTQSDPIHLAKPFYTPAINDDGGKAYPYAQFEVSCSAEVKQPVIECYLAILPRCYLGVSY